MGSRTRSAKRRTIIKQVPASGQKPGARLTRQEARKASEELGLFHQRFEDLFSRPEQRDWLWVYLCGQLSKLSRKTTEPLVLEFLDTKLSTVRAAQHFLGQSPWSSERLVEQVQALVADWLGEPEGVLILDESGFPKQGQRSIGVAHQYCGHLGKTANCQTGVFLVYASSKGFAFVDERLYIPDDWFDEAHQAGRQKCQLPEAVQFLTQPALGLEMITSVQRRGRMDFEWVTCDEGYSKSPSFLEGINELGLKYLAEVAHDTRIWERTPAVEAPGPGRRGRARLHPRVYRSAPEPVELQELMLNLEPRQWQRYVIKQGSLGPITAEFAFVRVTPLHDKLPGRRSWAVFRRSLGGERGVKYYLSNAPSECPTAELVRASGLRWPIETAIEEARGEVGFGHFETRTWLGWHHHMSLSMVAHLFLVRLQLSLKKDAPLLQSLKPMNSSRESLRTIPTRNRVRSISFSTPVPP